ncbi:hypothetical protein PRZ48_015131 [Zasmidium cellare]|uniref:Glutathione S-transferase n=1 Tax=Zasmidium cellare TaxID=395010 RepID=A0ABR0DY69_ZASCE|nr:hypothetical protein PRZ48_015131 [Zasmidium cellare]
MEDERPSKPASEDATPDTPETSESNDSKDLKTAKALEETQATTAELETLSRACIDAFNDRDFSYTSTPSHRAFRSRISPDFQARIENYPSTPLTWPELHQLWRAFAAAEPDCHFRILNMNTDVYGNGKAVVWVEVDARGGQNVHFVRLLEMKWRSPTSHTMSNPSGKVVLYDLPTKQPQCGCWSPNVWKTRMVLNYKKIPYTTTFITHEEITPTLSALGIPANPPKPAGAPGPPVSPYTVPAIQLPDGTAVMDSASIVVKLEELYPEPGLHLENNLHNEIGKVLGQLMMPIMAVCYPLIQRNVLVAETVPGWTAKKEAGFGMSIEELERTKGGEAAWKAAEPGFESLRRFLEENKRDEGPFVCGSQVSYVDFVVASMIESFKRIDGVLYERFCGNAPRAKVVHEACGEWLKEDQ